MGAPRCVGRLRIPRAGTPDPASGWSLKTLSCPVQVLSSTNWSVHVNVASNATASGRDVYGVVELGLGDPANPDAPSEPLLTEFTHDELYEFFQKLETIQEQLDELA